MAATQSGVSKSSSIMSDQQRNGVPVVRRSASE
jgi:hypothetical protein